MKLAEAIAKGSASGVLEAAYEGLTGQSSDGKTLHELVQAIRDHLEYEIDAAIVYNTETNMLRNTLLSVLVASEDRGDSKQELVEWVASWEQAWWPEE
jgi:hypothetical protein